MRRISLKVPIRDLQRGFSYPFGGAFLGLIIHKARIKGYFEVDNKVVAESVSQSQKERREKYEIT
jgi:hypothetical protein